MSLTCLQASIETSFPPVDVDAAALVGDFDFFSVLALVADAFFALAAAVRADVLAMMMMVMFGEKNNEQ